MSSDERVTGTDGDRIEPGRDTIAPSRHLIAVVDDDASVCESIARVLSVHGYRVAEFTSANEYLVQRSRQLQPACLLADIRMPELDGLELYRRTLRDGVDVPTIFMTGTTDVSLVVDAMHSGAADLLPKPFSPQKLFDAVERAIQRAGAVLDDRWSVVRLWASASQLTPREAEVAGYVASGLLNKQVAAHIGTREKTVKVHRARAMQKLGAHSLADLVRMTDRLVAIPVRRVILRDGSAMQRPPVLDRLVEAVKAAARIEADTSPEQTGGDA
ncbi:MAG TPA: response regulator [Gemmatimonadaceae bacterium]|nr:response regulator [Gemmatimonadaceae bacterium]